MPVHPLPVHNDRVATAGPVPAQLAARYDIAEVRVELPRGPVSLLTVRDTNALVDAIDPAQFAADERFPYWADLWASAVALAAWCESPGSLAPGETVLELGCGLGLAGIAASRAGALVTMTDFEEDALLFARANALRNPGAGRPSFRLFDWRSGEAPARVQTVIGADVTYERRMLLPLLETIGRCLQPGGRAVLAEPGRSIGAAFFELAAENGFTVRRHARRLPWRGREQEVVIAELRGGEGGHDRA